MEKTNQSKLVEAINYLNKEIKPTCAQSINQPIYMGVNKMVYVLQRIEKLNSDL